MAISLKLSLCVLLLALTGCYAPLHSPGIRANTLPDEFRAPEKAVSVELNYAMLSREVPNEYALGPDDVIRVEISDLAARPVRLPTLEGQPRQEAVPFSSAVDVRVAPGGGVMLPLVGSVQVSDLTLEQARDQITGAYAKGFIDSPRVGVTLVGKSSIRVLVLGEVARPDVYDLPKYENDIAHALTRAGGLTPNAGNEIQVHQRFPRAVLLPPVLEFTGPCPPPDVFEPHTLRIPRRSLSPVLLSPEQVTLQNGDIVIVPSRTDEVFFVVGKLSQNSLVRFTLGNENRDLGNAFVLPRDRDVDVVTAVAMAGYIDPIDSPTTVTVHRTARNGNPMLIHVDLIAARFDRRENVMVRAGDIIYLNPDAHWWFRRTFDRVIPNLITSPYSEAMERWINPRGTNNSVN